MHACMVAVAAPCLRRLRYAIELNIHVHVLPVEEDHGPIFDITTLFARIIIICSSQTITCAIFMNIHVYKFCI